jgi:hypothetical protein
MQTDALQQGGRTILIFLARSRSSLSVTYKLKVKCCEECTNVAAWRVESIEASRISRPVAKLVYLPGFRGPPGPLSIWIVEGKHKHWQNSQPQMATYPNLQLLVSYSIIMIWYMAAFRSKISNSLSFLMTVLGFGNPGWEIAKSYDVHSCHAKNSTKAYCVSNRGAELLLRLTSLEPKAGSFTTV